MGTQAVSNTQDGWGLLAKRKAQFESAKAQVDAVKAELSNIRKEQTNTEQQLKPLEDSVAAKIMILSNFNVTTAPTEVPKPTEPTAVPEPGAEPKQSNYEYGEGKPYPDKAAADDAYKKDHAEWKKKDDAYKLYQENLELYNKVDKPAYEKYQKDLKEFSQYQALKKEIMEDEKVPADVRDNLDKLMQAAQDKEKELIKNKAECDFSWNSYQELEQELKTANFDVELKNNGDNMTKVAKGLVKEASLDDKDADTNTVYRGILAGDKANKVAGKTVNTDYKHQKVGTKNSYTVDQVKAMGVDTDLSDDFGTELRDLLNNAPTAEPAKPEVKPEPKPEAKPETKPDEAATDPNAHYKKNGVTFARGIPYNSYGDDPAKWGVYQDDNGNYSMRDIAQAGINVALGKEPGNVRNLSDEELNAAMRRGEETVHRGYSKLLDKAESLGIDIEATIKGCETGDEAYKAVKEAVKAAEKEAKAAEKEAKAAEKEAKKIKEYTTQNTGLIDSLGIDVTKFKTLSALESEIKVKEKEVKDKIAQFDKMNATSGTNGASYAVEEPEDTPVTNPKTIDISTLGDDARRYLTDLKGTTATAPNGTLSTSVNTEHGLMTVRYEQGSIKTITIGDQQYKISDDRKTLIPS